MQKPIENYNVKLFNTLSPKRKSITKLHRRVDFKTVDLIEIELFFSKAINYKLLISLVDKLLCILTCFQLNRCITILYLSEQYTKQVFLLAFSFKSTEPKLPGCQSPGVTKSLFNINSKHPKC